MNYTDALAVINTQGLKNYLGRYNASRMKEAWLRNNGFGDLLDYVIENTTIIEGRTLSQRFWAFERLPIPICSCGQPVKKYDGEDRWSNYCSSACSLKSPERGRLISTTKLNQDHAEINAKREATMIKRYGVPFNSQRSDIKHRWCKSTLPEEIVSLLTDPVWMNEQYNVQKRSASDIALELKVFYGTVLNYCRRLGFQTRCYVNQSKEEKLLSRALREREAPHENNIFSIIHPHELDLYFPEKKIAVEVNGLYWHSLPGAEEKHFEKLEKCQSLDIFLFQFSDLEIRTKLDIVTSMILNKLGKVKKEDARKCTVSYISSREAKHFVVANHLHGFAPARIHIGLRKGDDLLMVMSVGRARFTNHDWEIIRLCSKLHVNVRGGLSKMLAFFSHNHSGSIMSYVDRRIGNGISYEKAGFNFVGVTSPGYVWTNGNVIISRFKAQKKQLAKWLPSFDINKTENENMTEAKYKKLWDCGNLVYEKSL